jgi:hypothetical protein
MEESIREEGFETIDKCCDGGKAVFRRNKTHGNAAYVHLVHEPKAGLTNVEHVSL